ncbi:hypothetical protein M758_12G023100 [Ceratodon purpureus]|nr:hypothetical protein M758_12G023100 [Ceratodon purpureus]
MGCRLWRIRKGKKGCRGQVEAPRVHLQCCTVMQELGDINGISSHLITSDYGKKKIHDGFVFCHSHCLVGLCPHRHSTSPTPNLLHISLSHALFMFIHHIPSAHGIVHLNSVYSSLPIVCSLSLSLCVCVVF